MDDDPPDRFSYRTPNGRIRPRRLPEPPLDPLLRKIEEAMRLAAEARAETLLHLLTLCELETRHLAGERRKGASGVPRVALQEG